MHRQIGNAVAWPVGAAFGRSLQDVMYKTWIADREAAIVID
jgi:DNA (cytosine-5)-methyltransferase 1